MLLWQRTLQILCCWRCYRDSLVCRNCGGSVTATNSRRSTCRFSIRAPIYKSCQRSMDFSWIQHGPVIDLLDEFFCWKSTLEEYYRYVFSKFHVENKIQDTVLNTKSEEVKNILKNTIVACTCEVQLIPGRPNLFKVYMEQRDLIMDIIRYRCKRGQANNYVISLGSSLPQNDIMGRPMSYPLQAQTDFPNTTATSLTLGNWELLHSLIGCDLMKYTLGTLSLFAKMPNGNLLQLTGKLVEKMPKLQNHVCDARLSESIPNFVPNNSCIAKEDIISNGSAILANDSSHQCNSYKLCNFGKAVGSKKNEHSSTITKHGSGIFFVRMRDDSKVANERESLKKPEKVLLQPTFQCETVFTNISVPVSGPTNKQLSCQIEADHVEPLCYCLGRKRPRDDIKPMYSGHEDLIFQNDFTDIMESEMKVYESSSKKRRFDVNKKENSEEKGVKSTMLNGRKENNEIFEAKTAFRYCSSTPLKFSEKPELLGVSVILSEEHNVTNDDAELSYPSLLFEKAESFDDCIVKKTVAEVTPDRYVGTKRTLKDFSNDFSRVKESKESRQTDELPKTAKRNGTVKRKRSREDGVKLRVKSGVEGKLQRTVLNVNSRSRRKGRGLKHKPVEPKIKENVFKIGMIMYNVKIREKLCKGHIIDKVDSSKKGARLLAENVFLNDEEMGKYKKKEWFGKQLSSNVKNEKSRKKIPKNLLRSLTLLRDFLGRYKKLKLKCILERNCPSSASVKTLMHAYRLRKKKKNKKNKGSQPAYFDKRQKLLYRAAVLDHVPPYQVFLFVKDMCRKALPREFLGTKSNWKVFFHNLKRFFTLRRNECLTLSQIMKGIKLSKCLWMFKSGRKPGHVQRSFLTWQTRVLERLLVWIVADFVMPLVKSCFYVTESGMHRGRLFYYRKHSWNVIEALGKDVSLGSDFERVEKEVVDRAVANGTTLGCARVRFVPKANKIRPIISMRRQKLMKFREVPRYVRLLRFFTVLKLVQRQQPDLTGCAVSDLDEINVKLKRFLKRIQEKGKLNSKLHFVASDIERCFDTMPHDKLVDVVGKSLQNYEYFIRRFCTTSYIKHKEVNTTRRYAATLSYEFFPRFLKTYLQSSECRLTNSIITDSVFNVHEDRETMKELLRKHIKESYVQLGDAYYRQVRGIAQGSMLSTTLCNILYGDMERNHLKEFLDSDECILLRWTDDYLLVTTSEELAKTFLKKLNAGFPEYGCFINLSKSRTNVACSFTDHPNGVKISKGKWFPWCHLLLNIDSLEVRFSYERYIGESIGDSITLRLDSRPGVRLLTKMKHQVQTRSAALILDPALNSYENILTNMYQIFCLAAVKLNYFIRSLPKDGQPNANPAFFKHVIYCTFSAFYRQYLKVQEKVCSNKTNLVSKKVAKGLYFAAIFRILGTRKSRYKNLLQLLRRRQKKFRKDQKYFAKYQKDSEVFDLIK